MRLVCPKCAAQYEVDPQAIPENGRDVQCASCGNTWFQDRMGEVTEPPAAFDASEVAEEEPAEESPAPRPPSATADRAILDILRREAELDAAARNGDLGPAEQTGDTLPEPAIAGAEGEPEYAAEPYPEATPEPPVEAEPEYEYEPEAAAVPETAAQDEPDLTVAELAARARAARENTRPGRPERGNRRLNLSDPAADPSEINEADLMPAPQRPGPMADLPDVESLKSSLRAAIDEERGASAKVKKRGRGGRSRRAGFYLALNIALLGLATYVLSDQLVEALPASAPYVEMFVNAVDSARRALASGVAMIIELIRGL